MSKTRTMIIPDDYTLTDIEIRVIVEMSEEAKRAEVGADLALSWHHGHMSKKILTLRETTRSARSHTGNVSIRDMEF